MHHHCEIVIPPTMNIEEAIASVLKPFDEQPDETSEDTSTRYSFWDWYVIGGRWAGHKLLAQYDQEKLDAFHAWLADEKVTVSGVQAGKQELSPSSQREKVDAKWNEMFPSSQFMPCPLFNHSNNQYGKGLSSTLPADVQRLEDVAESLTCSRVIFAKPSYDADTKDYTGPLEAEFMLSEDIYNGCNFVKSTWDGKFASALEMYRDKLKNYREEFAAKHLPKSDWLVVTVDYHS